MALLKPASTAVESRFLKLLVDYYILGISIQQGVKGGVIKNLHLEDIRVIALRLAPPKEQTEIILEVDRRLSVAEEIEAVIETNLKRAERMRQAILKKAFEGRLVR